MTAAMIHAVAMIHANPVEILETPERFEAWTMKENLPHALMLSCDLNHKKDLEEAIASIKALKPEEVWQ